MKQYKAVLNYGYKNENIIYFDRFTSKKINEIKESLSYVVLYFDSFFKKYIPFDYKLNKYQKQSFDFYVNDYTK